ncbi:MAG: thioredoxin [Ectothiorhodospiraceae bacterium]|nr:thioredoxin [Ectothiorhodospiraceae bacterium]
MYVFASADCPHCEAQKPFLQQLEADNDPLHIEIFEVLRTDRYHEQFRQMAAAHGVEPGSVPTIFVGGRVWVGDSPAIRTQIAAWVNHCLYVASCPESASLDQDLAPKGEPERTSTIDIPLFGTIDLHVQSLLFSTALIAFVDGFNPCSLWVLTILLALVIHSGSRLRVLIIGVTFLSVTAAIYGLFISGVFGILSYMMYLGWINWAVAGFALLFGLVNIKDYFWYKRGLSFTIDDRHKPGMFRQMRGLISEGRSIPALVLATIVMAAGIALIELPCTAGFPVIWSGLVAAQDIDWLFFGLLLGLYLLVYLGIELVIFIAALFTFRVDRFEERQGRVLKLVGGLIMLALAAVLLIRPELMQDIGGTLAVFFGALAVAVLLIVLHRRVLPAMGVRIGDE